jgi:hypothetical protein
LKDASSSHVLALTFRVFPGTLCIPDSTTRVVQPGLCFRRFLADVPKVVLLTPRDVLEIARLPGVFGPSGDRSDAATLQIPLACHLLPPGLPPLAPLRPRAFPAPRRFIPHRPVRPCFVSVSPLGFRCSFEGFSPSVAPGASRLAVSSVSLSPSAPLRSPRSIGFEDVSIGRMRCRRCAGLVRRDARSFLGRCPLRGLDLLGLAPRFRGAPLLGFSARLPP